MSDFDNDQHSSETVSPIILPYTRLSAEVLDAVIDDFVLREGTEYGDEERSLAAKKDQVMALLRKGTAEVCFDPSTETTTLRLR